MQVNCPGVWLCQSGPVKLMIRTLGYTFYTQAVQPRFPLILHELFTVEGYFRDVFNASDLRLKLISEPIDLSLYQNGHRLAFFRESLASLLTHHNCKRVLQLELLMSTTKCFPGILSPKVETEIEFTVSKYNPGNDCVHATATKENVGICWSNAGGDKKQKQQQQQQHCHNHAKLDEKRPQETRIKRQKAVCHQTHINNENTANFVPVNVLRKASDSSTTTTSLEGPLAMPRTNMTSGKGSV